MTIEDLENPARVMSLNRGNFGSMSSSEEAQDGLKRRFSQGPYREGLST